MAVQCTGWESPLSPNLCTGLYWDARSAKHEKTLKCVCLICEGRPERQTMWHAEWLRNVSLRTSAAWHCNMLHTKSCVAAALYLSKVRWTPPSSRVLSLSSIFVQLGISVVKRRVPGGRIARQRRRLDGNSGVLIHGVCLVSGHRNSKEGATARCHYISHAKLGPWCSRLVDGNCVLWQDSAVVRPALLMRPYRRIEP